MKPKCLRDPKWDLNLEGPCSAGRCQWPECIQPAMKYALIARCPRCNAVRAIELDPQPDSRARLKTGGRKVEEMEEAKAIAAWGHGRCDCNKTGRSNLERPR